MQKHFLIFQRPDDAMKVYKRILIEDPENYFALLGKARALGVIAHKNWCHRQLENSIGAYRSIVHLAKTKPGSVPLKILKITGKEGFDAIKFRGISNQILIYLILHIIMQTY